MKTEDPRTNRAVVLLSGGLDSSAALIWAGARYEELRAISFAYGQPNRDRELHAAQRIAAARGVPYRSLALADAFLTDKRMGIMAGDVEPSDRIGGIDRAFLPCRNLVFATIAASHTAAYWPNGNVDIVMGASAEDQAGFPDCRPTTMAKLGEAIRAGCGRSIMIRLPWADKTKSEILYAIQPDPVAFDLVRASWSCYRAEGPCGTCSACVKRAAAFAQRGVEDLCRAVPMHGGDPQRA